MALADLVAVCVAAAVGEVFFFAACFYTAMNASCHYQLETAVKGKSK